MFMRTTVLQFSSHTMSGWYQDNTELIQRVRAPQAPQWERIHLPSRSLGLGREGGLEEEMATHSSILAQEIPWTEELGRLQS